MNEETIDKLYNILNSIKRTEENEDLIDEIYDDLENENYIEAIEKMKNISDVEEEMQQEQKYSEEVEKKYPNELSDLDLERIYMGLLLKDPKLITKYYFLFEECFFEDDKLLNIYKSVLFTEGEAYASERAKRNFSFARENNDVYKLKDDLLEEIYDTNYNMENIYVELKKLFVLRKNYVEVPIKEIQDKIIEITNYELFSDMSVEEVENAVNQVNDTNKFKRAVLNEDLTKFLQMGDNNLTNGLQMPFKILNSVFKGIRKGETMAFAMPSNAGKSRFTVNLAAYTAFIHKKKVLVISNEMSEEKMRLCLITTILNNPEIQKLHGQKIYKTEGEILEFKYRPDNLKDVQVDENGFVVKQEKETQKQFVKRLLTISTEFIKTIEVTNWVNEQIKNSIYFINITDHTNDELKKVIINYYYKEKIEYVFYDTLKTDTANIGNGEELKKTATILSNIAQNFGIYICSTLQLAENSTSPINLDVNDLAVSRTVKEVLDTLCLVKQINRDNLDAYEYSINEVDTNFYNFEKVDDPDVRYYACVVDKNRAGAKPKLAFKLNLAYNSWEELGYLRLKQ